MHNVMRLSPDDKLNMHEYKPIESSTWNQEQWSKESPMDYIKAVKVINSFPVEIRQEIFKQIFTITRLYLPEILYKFHSITDDQRLNELKIKTLKNKEVFLAELSQFNDPFDGRAIFYNPDELKNLEVLKEHGGRLIDDFASYHIGTSLSATNYMNMPMWAHYSNNHRGYCVSYETSKSPMIRSFAFPIQYLDARIDISDYMVKFAEYALTEKKKQLALGNKNIVLYDLTLVFIIQLLDNIKGIDWSYEKEFRLSLPKTHPSRYVGLKPHQVYIGKNCDVDTENALINIAKNQNIAVYKMTQGTTSDGFAMRPVLMFSP